MKSIKSVLTFLLVVLFSYVALSKWLDFRQFKSAMLIQPFPHWFAYVLIYTLPAIELISAVLMLSKRTEWIGFLLAFILMTEFTGYVGLVLIHFWNELPCSCGGIFRHLSWGPHLAVNIFFLLITIAVLYIKILERRAGDKK